MCLYIFTRTHTRTHAHNICYACIHTHTVPHTCEQRRLNCRADCLLWWSACSYINPHTQTRTHTTYTRAHTHTHTHIYAHTHTHTHTHTHKHTHKHALASKDAEIVTLSARRNDPHVQHLWRFLVLCSVLQCVAVCCSALQCVVVCLSAWCNHPHVQHLWRFLVPCSVLQCVAVCCSVF